MRTSQGVRVPLRPPQPRRCRRRLLGALKGLTAAGLHTAHPNSLARLVPALPAWALGWAHTAALVLLPAQPTATPHYFSGKTRVCQG